MLHAYEDVMGKNGLNSILNLAGLNHLVENFPPDNLEREFDYADIATIHLALEEMYGPRGGRGLALRIGKVTFNDFMRYFGALAGFNDPDYKKIPVEARLHISLLAASKIFSQMTDQATTVLESKEEFLWLIHNCPICYGRNNLDKPICFSAIGFLQAMLSWVSGGLEYKVYESKCCALGEAVCEIVIQKGPITVTN